MHRADDFARLRDSIDEATDAANSPTAFPPNGNPRRACKTTHLTAYPTGGSNCFVAVEEQTLSGTESEGSAVVETGTGRKWLAACLGAVPPEGTKVECVYTPDRWSFIP